jgi:hypothetical protein
VSHSVDGLLQRKCDCGNHTGGGECGACQKNRKTTLHRSAINSDQAQAVPSIVHEVLRSPGQPLDGTTRAFFEPRFGNDFAQVRIHTDARAAESARAVNALAYTIGSNVVFGAGQYAPAMARGKELLAHELVHVIQQASATASDSFAVGDADSAAEHEAATVATQALSGRSVACPAQSHTRIQLARHPDGPTPAAGPPSPSRVDLIRVSCESNTIEFETDAGVFIYELIDCDIEDADYIATVTVEGNNVNFSAPTDAPGAHARFPYRIVSGQPNPSTFFPSQTTVHIVTGTLAPTPGPVPGPVPGPSPAPAATVRVCSRDLQIAPVGKHAYIEAPPFRYAVISPTCPQHWYDNPVTGTSGQKWDNSPDPCSKSPTCIDCLPAPGVTDVAKCMRDAFSAYANPSLYKLSGPNSNTFAGTLARTCCAGMVPKPPALGWCPAWDDAPAPARGAGPCPPGPTC